METIVIPENMAAEEEDDKENEDDENLMELHFTLLNSAVDFHEHSAEEENDSFGGDSAMVQCREMDDAQVPQHQHPYADFNYSKF